MVFLAIMAVLVEQLEAEVFSTKVMLQLDKDFREDGIQDLQVDIMQQEAVVLAVQVNLYL
jgi:hypothetical protein